MTRKEKREIIWNKFNKKCAYCGTSLDYDKMQVDHVTPRHLFVKRVNEGKLPEFNSHLGIEDIDHIDNLFPACRPCNRLKDTFDLGVFRIEVESQVKRMESYCTNAKHAIRFGKILVDKSPVVFHYEKFFTDIYVDKNKIPSSDEIEF